MPSSRPFDHRLNSRFMVEIEGVASAAFTACDGLEARVDVVDFADGSDWLVHKRPGQVRYANIVLRRGVVSNTELWAWFKSVLDGQVARKAGSIVLLDDMRNEVSRYNFSEAWPCRWKGFSLDAQAPGALVEEIELAVEKIERA